MLCQDPTPEQSLFLHRMEGLREILERHRVSAAFVAFFQELHVSAAEFVLMGRAELLRDLRPSPSGIEIGRLQAAQRTARQTLLRPLHEGGNDSIVPLHMVDPLSPEDIARYSTRQEVRVDHDSYIYHGEYEHQQVRHQQQEYEDEYNYDYLNKQEQYQDHDQSRDRRQSARKRRYWDSDNEQQVKGERVVIPKLERGTQVDRLESIADPAFTYWMQLESLLSSPESTTLRQLVELHTKSPTDIVTLITLFAHYLWNPSLIIDYDVGSRLLNIHEGKLTIEPSENLRNEVQLMQLLLNAPLNEKPAMTSAGILIQAIYYTWWTRDYTRGYACLQTVPMESITTHHRYVLAKYNQCGWGIPKDWTTSISLLRSIESKKHAYAIATLGDCLFNQEKRESHLTEAVALYRLASELGSLPASNAIGICEIESLGSLTNAVSDGIQKLEMAALRGFHPAKYNLAMYFKSPPNTSIPQDLERYEHWIKQAAHADIIEAYLPHGLVLLQDSEIETPREAVAWIEKAVLQGNADAKYHLGRFCLKGTIVPMDKERAFRLFQEASLHGSLDATYELGLMYLDHTYSRANPAIGFQYHILAASHKHLNSILSVAKCYENGIGVAKSNESRIQYLEAAAKLGDGVSSQTLGDLYSQNVDDLEAQKKALDWYIRAAELGMADAKNQLGFRFFFGKGCPVDHQRAVEYFRDAHLSGCGAASFNLAYAYQTGRGVTKDIPMAIQLYEQCIDTPNGALAMKNIGICYMTRDSPCYDSMVAERLFRQAIQLGESKSKYYLGRILSKRKNLNEQEEGRRLLQEASLAGDQDATKYLQLKPS